MRRSHTGLSLIFQEKLQLRLKVLEEGLKAGNGAVRRPTGAATVEAKRSSSVTSNGSLRKPGGAEEGAKVLANGSRTWRSAVSQLRAMAGPILKNGRLTSKSFDGGRSDGRSFDPGPLPVMKPFTNGFEEVRTGRKSVAPAVSAAASKAVGSEPLSPKLASPEPASPEPEPETAAAKQRVEDGAAASTVAGDSTVSADGPVSGSVADTVSGVLYDMLQKEVISLRKSSQEKDQSLKDKDNAIEVRPI